MLLSVILLQPVSSSDNGALTQYLDAYAIQDKIVFARHTIGKRLDSVGLPSLPKYLLLSEFCTWHNAKALEFRYSGHEIAFSSFDGMVTGKLNEDSKVLNLKIAQGAVKQCLVKPLQPTRKSDFAFRRNLDYLIPLDVALWMGRGDINLVRNRLEMDTIKRSERDELQLDIRANKFVAPEPGSPVVPPPIPIWGFCGGNVSRVWDNRLEFRVVDLRVGSRQNLMALPRPQQPLSYSLPELLKYQYVLVVVVSNRCNKGILFYPGVATLIRNNTPLFPTSWENAAWTAHGRVMGSSAFPRSVWMAPGESGNLERVWHLDPTDEADFYYNDGISKFRIPLKKIGYR